MNATTNALTPTPAAELVQQSRLYAQRSNAWLLLQHKYDDDDVAAALSINTRRALPIALAGVQRELAPVDMRLLLTAITTFIGLVGQNWTAAGRDEFLALAAGELGQLPGGFVLPAIERAKRKIHSGAQLVPFVFNEIEDSVARLRAEEDGLLRLSALADRAKD